MLPALEYRLFLRPATCFLARMFGSTSAHIPAAGALHKTALTSGNCTYKD